MAALRARYPRLRAVGGIGEDPVASAPARLCGQMRSAEGVGFTILHVHAGVPVLWPVRTPIAVRAVGDKAHGLIADLDVATAELRTLTGLDLEQHDPDPETTLLRKPGEIRVLVTALASPPAGSVEPQTAFLGVGSALASARCGVLVSGFAVVDPERCVAVSTSLIGVLRHELGHALGLHHANRTGCVMSRHLPADTWAPGDVAGLHRVGVGRL